MTCRRRPLTYKVGNSFKYTNNSSEYLANIYTLTLSEENKNKVKLKRIGGQWNDGALVNDPTRITLAEFNKITAYEPGNFKKI